MSTDATRTTFILQDNLTGQFLPGRFTWEEAQAEAREQVATVRRLDEVLAETGRA